MPNNDSETVPQDGTLVETTAKPLRGERILAELAFVRSAFLSIAIVLAVAAVLIVTIQDLMRAPVVLEEINVPENLREQGYTGLVSSNLLWDAIEGIRNATGDREKRVRIQTASRQLDVVEPGSGLSLQRLTQLLRALFNLPQTRISGEFACPLSVGSCEAKNMALKVRIYSGKGTRVIHAGSIEEDTIEDYFHKSALRVLSEEIDPLVAARYYFGVSEVDDWEAKAKQIATRLFWERGDEGQRGEHAAESAILLGWLAHYNSDFDGAIGFAKEAIKTQADMDAAQGLWSRSAGWFDKTDPNLIRAEALTIQAYALSDKGQPEAALPLYQEVAQNLSEDDPWIWLAWGAALLALEKPTKAEEKFAEALDRGLDDPTLRSALGGAFLDMGKIEQFNTQFKIATDLDPEDPYLWNDWGLYLQEMEQLDDAVGKFKVATDLAPYDAYLWGSWGDALYAMGEFNEASLKYAKATELVPDDPYYWSRWGDTLYKMEKFDEADQKYRKADELSQD